MNTTATLPNVSTNRTISIDGMSGDGCVQKVKAALAGVTGVTSPSVKVGSATFGADQTAFNAARSAISAAGFKCREGAAANTAPIGSPNAAKPSDHASEKAPVDAVAAPIVAGAAAPSGANAAPKTHVKSV
ncbi:MAG: heavy-metal-associated domain-containing protein [Phycisphaerales bacterium]